ncbi:cysteine hydrolase family protein [Egicoccus sp. AB-alg2]|uniref:cysteine hydrolase family protein n=1 Tax=Egicoccus sp. AB-alg2 TaxID=3242693 RepID=UPI00359E05C1
MAIDVQNDFCDPSGALARLGADVSANEAMVDALARTLPGLREVGFGITAVRQVTSLRTTSPARRRRMAALGRDPLAVCAEGSWGAELHPGAGFSDADQVIEKHRYSAFVDTALPLLLRSARADGIIVVGTAANVCVDSTVRDAFMRDFEVIVVPELVGWTDQRLGRPAIDNLGRHFATLMDADDLLSAVRHGQLQPAGA